MLRKNKYIKKFNEEVGDQFDDHIDQANDQEHVGGVDSNYLRNEFEEIVKNLKSISDELKLVYFNMPFDDSNTVIENMPTEDENISDEIRESFYGPGVVVGVMLNGGGVAGVLYIDNNHSWYLNDFDFNTKKAIISGFEASNTFKIRGTNVDY